MSNPRTIVAISGSHGVGKSTAIRILCDQYDVEQVPQRYSNPFRSQYLSMLFYSVGFADRELSIRERAGLVFVDRHAVRDILVDAWTLAESNYMTEAELETVALMATRVLLPFGTPDFSVLLDDEPVAVMKRLRARPLPGGHSADVEYDEEFLGRTVANYRREWESEAISVGRLGVRVASPISTIVFVGARRPEEVSAQVQRELVRHGFAAASPFGTSIR